MTEVELEVSVDGESWYLYEKNPTSLDINKAKWRYPYARKLIYEEGEVEEIKELETIADELVIDISKLKPQKEKMFRSGEFVAEHLEPHDGDELDNKQIQPNGVDLTIDEVVKLRGPCVIGDDEYRKNIRKEAKTIDAGNYVKFHRTGNHKSWTVAGPDEVNTDSDLWEKIENESYILPRGTYVAIYNEKVKIPEEHVGFVLPRSRLLRTGNHLTTAVWDSGYEGRGEGTLQIGTMTFLEKDMRIGQMVMAKAHTMGESYAGQHQGERLDDYNGGDIDGT